MEAAILEYQVICQGYPRCGIGLEPLCTDVGLEDPGRSVMLDSSF